MVVDNALLLVQQYAASSTECMLGCAVQRDGKSSIFGAVLFSSACATITCVTSHRPTSLSSSPSYAVTATTLHRRLYKSDAASFETLHWFLAEILVPLQLL